jgi:hypothetical protein
VICFTDTFGVSIEIRYFLCFMDTSNDLIDIGFLL